MGEHIKDARPDAESLRVFVRRLLRDIQALERMIAEGRIESGIRRIGAEQELFLVDRAWRAMPTGRDICAQTEDPHVTLELGRFNLEFNLDPAEFGGDCLRKMEKQLNELLRITQKAAHLYNTEVVMTGILPTLTMADLTLDMMTDEPRYYALNDAFTGLRGGDYEFRIKGPDELLITHDTVMFEACNTSFQCHFQVAADEFARLYNIAQLVTAPLLAAATNSPMLFGKRLWQETRIALFQQSLDTRTVKSHQRDLQPRVSFGTRWVKDSVLEIFQEDIARFRVLLATETEEDPLAVLDAGEIPTLDALRLHNGTVYRWNRPCYGIMNGKPHLRIENRVLPAGPTTIDAMANAAFWFGLMAGMADKHDDITERMAFDDAKANFLSAARLGLDAQFRWFDGKTVPAQTLIRKKLLPLAQDALEAHGISSNDIERYSKVLEERVASGRTPSRWLVDSLAGMQGKGTKSERLAALTAATFARQQTGEPGHTWEYASLEEAGGWKENFLYVEQYMTTDLITVDQDELIDLLANLMVWRHIRYIPVEDGDHQLVGIVSYRHLLRYLVSHDHTGDAPVSVKEVMFPDPVTVTPESPTLEALELMRRHRIGCLPVVSNDKLVGIVTEADFMSMAGQLLEEKLRE